MLGDMELGLALIAALILFGPEDLPKMARRLGEAIQRIRDAAEGKELKG